MGDDERRTAAIDPERINERGVEPIKYVPPPPPPPPVPDSGIGKATAD